MALSLVRALGSEKAPTTRCAEGTSKMDEVTMSYLFEIPCTTMKKWEIRICALGRKNADDLRCYDRDN